MSDISPVPGGDNAEAKAANTKPSDRIEFLAEARARFNRCVDTTSENRIYQLDDLKFAAGSPDNGWQWPIDVLQSRMRDPNGARPTLTINKLTQHIKLVTNEQRKNKPMGRVMPVDDNSDIEVAEVLNGIIRHIEVASHADIAYDTACENQVTIGEGYWRILTDYIEGSPDEQEIRIVPIKNSFAVYMDPDGLKRDSVGRLCQYGFVTERMSTERYEQEFPNAKSKEDWEQIQTGDDSWVWFDDDGVMIAEYFYITHEKVKIVRWSDGSITKGDEMPPVAGLMPTASRDEEVAKVHWCKINGIEVLEESDWAGKYIPLIRIVGNEWDVEGQLVTSGLVRNAKDPQRMINYWASQDAELNALAPKAPFIGATGQFETMEDRWRDANTTNFAFLEYDPIDVNGTALPPPQRVQPPQVAAGIISAKLQAGDDLQSVVGQYNPSLGADAKEKSGRAIMARQQQADVGTFHYVDNLSRGIAYSTEQILDLIPKVYDTRRVVRIIGEDGEPDHATISCGQGQAVTQEMGEDEAIAKIYDPSVGRYDVVVSVGPSFQTKRMESQEFLTAQAQAAKDPVTAQVLSYLALKSADWPEADEASDMLKRLLPPQVQDEPQEGDVQAQAQKVQQAAQAIGQREAALQNAEQQIGEAAQQAEEKEMAARNAQLQAESAAMRAQKVVDDLNAQQAKLDAERREFELAKKLAEAELRAAELESKLAISEAKAKAEKAISDQQQNQIAERLLGVENKLGAFEVVGSRSDE